MKMKAQGELNGFLDEIHFADGRDIFAVEGNIDRSGWTNAFESLGVTTARVTRSFELAELRLTCLAMHESRGRVRHLSHNRPDRFHIVLGHVPNFALGPIDADLLLAGHTHGGQVRLPLIGPLMTLSELPRSWAAGKTELPGGATLIVSRGVGMERAGAPRLRFLCRPELVVIDLIPEGRKKREGRGGTGEEGKEERRRREGRRKEEKGEKTWEKT